MKFNHNLDRAPIETWCLVECEEYCESGFCVAKYNGDKWNTEDMADVTDYVTGWINLEKQ